MPAKSKKQFNFMRAAMSGAITGPSAPSKAVAKEFVEKTPAKKRKAFSKNLRSSNSGY